MFRALNTAASGMIAQQMNLDNIANNLANASTAGFRTRRLQFQDHALSEPGHARRGFHPADHLLDGLADRSGRALLRLRK